MNDLIPSWKRVWREGFQPQFNDEQLTTLLQALKDDDPTLVQGATTIPPPLMTVQDWPVEGCCPVGFAGWKGLNLDTVGEVEEHFARSCFEADSKLGELAACRYLLNFWDDTPRTEARKELAAEIELELKQREIQAFVDWEIAMEKKRYEQAA